MESGVCYSPIYEVNMIKQCKILLKNKDVIVFEYDGTEIQITNTSNYNEKIAYVNFVGGKYILCSKDDYEKEISKSNIKEIRKEVNESDE
jgi:hypothetical protein